MFTSAAHYRCSRPNRLLTARSPRQLPVRKAPTGVVLPIVANARKPSFVDAKSKRTAARMSRPRRPRNLSTKMDVNSS